MSYLILDLETSGSTTFKRFCNPLDPRHSITAVAYKDGNQPEQVLYNKAKMEVGVRSEQIFKHINLFKYKYLIGHNLKFDLLWFWKDVVFQEWLKQGGKVWDTLTIEYLLSGQRKGKKNLDELATKYGGTLKDDKVSLLFKQGIQSKDVPLNLLIPYAKADVKNTHLIFVKQYKQIKKLNMFPLVYAYMNHYLAVTEMEYNGLYVDLDTGLNMAKKITTELEDLHITFNELVKQRWTEVVAFNPGSLEHVSALLFGGLVKYVKDVVKLDPDGNPIIYKSGKRKGEKATKKEKDQVEIEGLNLSTKGIDLSKNGYYNTNEKTLTLLLERKLKSYQKNVINLLLKYRQKTKLLTTYLYLEEKRKDGSVKSKKGMLSLVHPHTGCVHTEFRTALTSTGRLSSKNPNVQNLAPEILHIFTSRWGDEGMILELDYKQLEIVVQAYLTQSKNFINDIKNNIDFHCKRLAYAENLSYNEVVANCATSPEWKEKRKKAKVISFQKAYGARPEKIADSTKLPLETVKRIFKLEDEAYPEIEEFYKKILKSAQKTRYVTNDEIYIKRKSDGSYFQKEGENEAFGNYRSLTGKLYSFKEKAVETNRGVFRYFNMPDIQDYPIQGTAADIVAIQVGNLFRYFQNHRDKCLIINEVHDSILLDVKKEHLDWTIDTVRAILIDIDKSFRSLFKKRFNVPIQVDVKYGNTWKECK